MFTMCVPGFGISTKKNSSVCKYCLKHVLILINRAANTTHNHACNFNIWKTRAGR